MVRDCVGCLATFEAPASRRRLCDRCRGPYLPNSNDYKGTKLFNKYKITWPMFLTMYAEQDGKCLVPSCNKEATHVDHDHGCCPSKKTCGNCVRGLLCSQCNMLLGWYETNREWIHGYTE